MSSNWMRAINTAVLGTALVDGNRRTRQSGGLAGRTNRRSTICTAG
jgi:hypothetical protein